MELGSVMMRLGTSCMKSLSGQQPKFGIFEYLSMNGTSFVINLPTPFVLSDVKDSERIFISLLVHRTGAVAFQI